MTDKQNSPKSFFERLTGTLKFDENEAVDATTIKTKRVDFNTDDTTQKTEVPSESQENIPSQTPSSPDKTSSSWLSEAQEGQLTIDVYQTESDIIIKSTIAGVKPEDLDIAITNDMVTIRGKREREEEIKQQNYYYQECYWGAFSRSVILPVDVAADKSEATMKNGILTLRLPKVEKEQTKKIKVKPII